MADNKSPEDRSMSEILASIRRIVSDEEKARREAETSRRSHEKEAGESVLTLTPDMRPEDDHPEIGRSDPNRGESLSEALGVTVAAVADHDPADDAAPVSTLVLGESVETTNAASDAVDDVSSGSFELPALELGKSDLATEETSAPEPLVLRRASLRRETDQAEEPAPIAAVAPEQTPAPTSESGDEAPEINEAPAAIEPEPEAAPVELGAISRLRQFAGGDEEVPEPEPAPEPVVVQEVEIVAAPEPEAVPEPEVVPEPETAAKTAELEPAAPEPVAAEPAKPKEPTPEPPTAAAAAPISRLRQFAEGDQEVEAETPSEGEAARVQADADDGLLDDDVLADPIMTEAEVEAIVRRVVREELQGPIGQQISRKVKRMIKDEIRKALYEDDSLI